MKLLLLTLLTVGDVQADLKQPSTRILTSDRIQDIGIHHDINTLLIFPEKVTLAMGHGLTDGASPGAIHQELGQDERVLVWRHLGGKEKSLVQVMLGDKAYVFRVTLSETPETLIRFVKKAEKKPVKKVVPSSTIKKARKLSPMNQRQLIDLAKSSPFLKAQMPDQYRDFTSATVSSDHSESGLKTTIQKVSRFAKDDALIVLGKVTNTSDQMVSLMMRKPYLIVGSRRQYGLPKPYFVSTSLAPGKTTKFEIILIGDGQGGAAHLSVENHFRLRLTQ